MNKLISQKLGKRFFLMTPTPIQRLKASLPRNAFKIYVGENYFHTTFEIGTN